MGRQYAGILGLLAMAVVAVRGIRFGGQLEPTLLTAVLAMVVFAGIGFIAGSLAASIVTESVRGRVEAELASQQSKIVQKSSE